MINTIKAVIFDLDGTLLNTLEDIADSMNAALAASGFQPHPTDAYRYLIGQGVMNLARSALPAHARGQAIVQKVTAAMRQEYGKRWAVKTRPYDGISELLAQLHDRGTKTAVLSNKPDDFTRTCVDTYFPKHRFDAVLGERPWIPKKPDPTAAFEIARILGLSPAFFACIGDSDIDMKTATAAGMAPIGAVWGFRTAEELAENGAEGLIHTPADLLSLIEKHA